MCHCFPYAACTEEEDICFESALAKSILAVKATKADVSSAVITDNRRSEKTCRMFVIIRRFHSIVDNDFMFSNRCLQIKAKTLCTKVRRV